MVTEKPITIADVQAQIAGTNADLEAMATERATIEQFLLTSWNDPSIPEKQARLHVIDLTTRAGHERLKMLEAQQTEVENDIRVDEFRVLVEDEIALKKAARAADQAYLDAQFALSRAKNAKSEANQNWMAKSKLREQTEFALHRLGLARRTNAIKREVEDGTE